jgi:hypothetical protein
MIFLIIKHACLSSMAALGWYLRDEMRSTKVIEGLYNIVYVEKLERIINALPGAPPCGRLPTLRRKDLGFDKWLCGRMELSRKDFTKLCPSEQLLLTRFALHFMSLYPRQCTGMVVCWGAEAAWFADSKVYWGDPGLLAVLPIALQRTPGRDVLMNLLLDPVTRPIAAEYGTRFTAPMLRLIMDDPLSRYYAIPVIRRLTSLRHVTCPTTSPEIWEFIATHAQRNAISDSYLLAREPLSNVFEAKLAIWERFMDPVIVSELLNAKRML